MLNRRVMTVFATVVWMTTPAVSQVTNFSRDVSTAIDRGIDWLDIQAVYQDPSTAQDAAGLAALALLEKRRGVDPNAPSGGYANAQADDQASGSRSSAVPRSTRPASSRICAGSSSAKSSAGTPTS
jgi:hypothetical protein